MTDTPPRWAVPGAGDCLSVLATTRHVETGSRFEYWQTLFAAAELEPSAPGSAAVCNGFTGSVFRAQDDRGVMFDAIASDPLISRFGQQQSGMVLLGYCRSRMVAQNGSIETVVDATSDGLILIDCDQPTVLTSQTNEVSYVAIPRSLIVEATGADPLSGLASTMRLPDGGLTPVLRSHLDLITAHGQSLTMPELRTCLQVAGDLAVTLLAAIGHRRPANQLALNAALFAAAERQIRKHLHRPELTAHDIAVAVGCSRAHLYRVFAARQRTVGGVLRTARLQRARALIKHRVREPIGLIAFRCGYTDLSAFGKAYRQQFGRTPRDSREAADRAADPALRIRDAET